MRKLFTILALGAMTLGASAQYEGHKFFDNWSLGVNGGAITPTTHHAFWKSCRPNFGLELTKQISPVFAVAVEGEANVNTTPSWNAIDQLNVSWLNKVNLTNLFCGYKGKPRFFELEAVAGIGIANDFVPSTQDITQLVAPGVNLNDETTDDYSYLTSKFGLNLLFNLGAKKAWTFALKPAIVYNLDGEFFPGVQTYPSGAHWNVNASAIELRAGLTYHFKSSNGEHYFTKVRPYDQAEVDGLNARINALRGEVADRDSRISDLENEVNDLRNRKPQVVEKIVEKVVEGKSTNALETAVYFQIGKSVIPASQLPSVERVAAYLKNHADSKVVIRGYASKDGPEELNVRLAENRAQAVKNLLVKKYGVAESRIDAAGNGISEMFSEAEWNRVSICTMEEK
ncbi:MAG: OmpA family protein [Alloprevotella sp.]|nr:OmpA family protein [Alloprevotella sp.]